MNSGIHLIDKQQDETFSDPTSGQFMGTRCGTCSGWKQDARSGPCASLFRYVTKFCACPAQKPTIELSMAAIEELRAAALAAG